MAFVAVASVATVHSNATDGGGDEGEFASAAAKRVARCPGNRSDAMTLIE